MADDLREWYLASGRPEPTKPIFPAHDGGFWRKDDWRNWRTRVWQDEPERPRHDRSSPKPARRGCGPAGTRPRDLRSSFITLRVYEGIPLTQIAREAGVIANWHGKQVPAEDQIRAARRAVGRGMDVHPSAPQADT